MNSIIKLILIPFIQQFMEQLLSKENYQVYGDRLFDFIEEMVKNTETKFDDMTVLPAIAAIRKLTNIPDLPDNGDERIAGNSECSTGYKPIASIMPDESD